MTIQLRGRIINKQQSSLYLRDSTKKHPLTVSEKQTNNSCVEHHNRDVIPLKRQVMSVSVTTKSKLWQDSQLFMNLTHVIFQKIQTNSQACLLFNW